MSSNRKYRPGGGGPSYHRRIERATLILREAVEAGLVQDGVQPHVERMAGRSWRVSGRNPDRRLLALHHGLLRLPPEGPAEHPGPFPERPRNGVSPAAAEWKHYGDRQQTQATERGERRRPTENPGVEVSMVGTYKLEQ